MPVIFENEKFLNEMKNMGTRIHFFLYEILLLRFSECFLGEITESFDQYLKLVSKYDGVITDFKSVAEGYIAWRKRFQSKNDSFSVH